jgi:2-polyprenyl-6-hydroxyphenyl methylase/3-demethylubiquinone-9 3-methyltransferase
MNTNVDRAEIEHFERLAARWWDPRGEMAALHAINPVRTRYIERAAGGLRDKTALDVGCGGGLLTEALARGGARVTGIDLAQASIEVAQAHAREQKLDIEYRTVSAEALAAERPGSFDLVCCLEMLEHVPHPASVVAACAQLTRPGGTVVFSTINRNPKAYALIIIAAEYAFGLVPRGTHDYAKFIRPSELDRWARNAALQPREVIGLRYNPVLRSASLDARDVDVNYLMKCEKHSAEVHGMNR